MRAWARYLTPAPVHDRLGLVCLGVGACTGKVASLSRRTLDCFAGVLISNGSGHLQWGDREYELKAPLLFWLTPGVQHSYTPDTAGWDEWWVLFNGSAVQAYTELGYLSSTEPVLPLIDPTPLERAFAAVARACRSEHGDAEVSAAAAIHSLIVTTRRSAHPQGIAGAPLLAALLRNAYRPLTVADHARELGLSVTALRDGVRRTAGCGPKEYLLRARLNRAKELLATTDLTVAAVARLAGYPDSAYFTRLFTRRTGQTPSRFRLHQRRGLRRDE